MAQAKDTASRDDDDGGKSHDPKGKPAAHGHGQAHGPHELGSKPEPKAKPAAAVDDDDKPEPKGGKALPAGEGPIEYRQKKGVPLAEAGSVVKEAWVGRVLGRSVRVYRGAPESTLPPAVRTAIEAAGIEIGVITLQELGIIPRTTGIVNLGQ
jgi:hypothetical protein